MLTRTPSPQRFLTSAATLSVLLLLLLTAALGLAPASPVTGEPGVIDLPAQHSERVTVSGELRRWHPITLTFDGPETSESADPNPFRDYRLTVTFSHNEKTYEVPGYYAADGDAASTGATAGNKWRVHFTPDLTGTWTFTASFRTGDDIALKTDPGAGSSTSFDGETGNFEVLETNKSDPDFRKKGRLEYVGQHHLRFAGDGSYFLKHGANSPENFLAYDDFDDTFDTGGVIPNFIHVYEPHAGDWNPGDPTWKAGLGKNIIGALNYLNSQNINSVYFLTYTLDGGDGMDVWMWTQPEERYRFDVSKLDQWDIVFSHMDRLGIQLHVVTQELENDEVFGGEAGLNPIRRLYYRELVARFGHHLAVQWNIGEENQNTDAERIAFAEYIRALDPYDHPIAIHTFFNVVEDYYDDLYGNPNFDATSIQGDGVNYNQWAITLRDLSDAAGRKWAIYGDEQGPRVEKDMSNVGQVVRESLWGNLMGGGAGAEWYFGYQSGFGDLQSESWRVAEPLWQRGDKAIRFFREHLPFWQMSPNNALINGDGLALAEAGKTYAIYLPTGTNDFTPQLDLENNADTFQVYWYDPINGGNLQRGSVTKITGPGSRSLGQPPSDTDREWAGLVTLDDLVVPTPVPTAAPDTELLRNPGFETAGTTGTEANEWKVVQLTKSKRVCNKPEVEVARTGDCAFRFKGIAGSVSSIRQTVKTPFGEAGDSLNFSGWMKGKNLTGGVKIQAKVIYAGGDKTTLKLTPDDGTYAYSSFDATLILDSAVKKVKILLSMSASKGKLLIDDTSLIYTR